MGEITYIKHGIATTIHTDGSISKEITELCDSCNEYMPRLGGLAVTVVGGDEVMWQCSRCRG